MLLSTIIEIATNVALSIPFVALLAVILVNPPEHIPYYCPPIQKEETK